MAMKNLKELIGFIVENVIFHYLSDDIVADILLQYSIRSRCALSGQISHQRPPLFFLMFLLQLPLDIYDWLLCNLGNIVALW